MSLLSKLTYLLLDIHHDLGRLWPEDTIYHGWNGPCWLCTFMPPAKSDLAEACLRAVSRWREVS